MKLSTTYGVLIYDIFELFGRNSILLNSINFVVPLHSIFGKGCEVWKYNHTTDQWSPFVSNSDGAVIQSGFNNRKNFAAAVICSFNEDLYIGTGSSSIGGCEIWKWDGNNLELIIKNGFGDRYNSGAWCSSVYKDELYIGTMNWKNGCQIWKSNDGDNWEKMEIPGGDGFGTNWNIYAWTMGVFNDSLFVGTCNTNPLEGCQLWRYNGNNWLKMKLPGGDGFGNPDNYGIRNIVEYNNEMYISTATNFIKTDMACEIWKYDGKNWFQVIGENAELSDGFGDFYNKYGWSMIATSENKLMVGTMSLQQLIDDHPFNTYGCEIWSYDGDLWEELIGSSGNDGISGGFNDLLNIGARTMIEYPKESGIIWVGTCNMDFKNFETFNGCEIWKRTI